MCSVFFTISTHDRKDVERHLKTARPLGRLRQVHSLLALLPVMDGQSFAEVAVVVHVPERTVAAWVRVFCGYGLQGAPYQKLTGHPPKLTSAQQEALAKLMKEGEGGGMVTLKGRAGRLGTANAKATLEERWTGAPFANVVLRASTVTITSILNDGGVELVAADDLPMTLEARRGSDANGAENIRTGSHDVVVGHRHNFSRFGELVVGDFSTISSDVASVSERFSNTASGGVAVVSRGATTRLEGIAPRSAAGVATWPTAEEPQSAGGVTGRQTESSTGSPASAPAVRHMIVLLGL